MAKSYAVVDEKRAQYVMQVDSTGEVVEGGVGGGGGSLSSTQLPTDLGEQVKSTSLSVTEATDSALMTQIGDKSVVVAALLSTGDMTVIAALKKLVEQGESFLADSDTVPTTGIGTVAHDAAAASVAPLLVGGYASAAAPTSVSADGDATDAWFLRNGAQVNAASGGVSAHDAAGASVNPLPIAYASAAAPSDVSADNDIVRPWHLRNGAQAVNITAAGALIPGDATVGLKVSSGGNVAHDAVDSGNPVKMGGRAVSAEITPVSAADRTDFLTDLAGKHIVLPYANPENFVSGAITSAMTGTTTTSLIASPGGALRNYITQITVSNSHATVGTDIIIQDGSGGTTLYVIPAAPAYGGAVLTFPTPLRQPTTATAIFCANVTTGSNTKVSASGYKGV